MTTVHSILRQVRGRSFEFECQEIKIMGLSDHEEPFFRGPGKLSGGIEGMLEFHLDAQFPLPSERLDRVTQALRDQEPMRLFAKDIEGTEWAGAWFEPIVDFHAGGRPSVCGKFQQLSARVLDVVVPEKVGSTELYYAERLPLPIGGDAEIQISKEGTIEWISGRKPNMQIDCLWIRISQDPDSGFTNLLAQHHHKLPLPFPEQALQDAMIYVTCRMLTPRVAVRYLDRDQLFFIRQCSLNPRSGLPSALMINRAQPDAVWKIFLAFVKQYLNSQEFTSVEVAKITQEVVRASAGTIHNLIVALVLAIENLVMRLAPEERATNPEDLRKLGEYISAWDGDKALKNRALALITMAGTKSPGEALKYLGLTGSVTPEQAMRWKGLRPKISHGGLTNYEDKDLPQDRALMIEMFHRLILRTIGYRGPIADFSSSPLRFVAFDWKEHP